MGVHVSLCKFYWKVSQVQAEPSHESFLARPVITGRNRRTRTKSKFVSDDDNSIAAVEMLTMKLDQIALNKVINEEQQKVGSTEANALSHDEDSNEVISTEKEIVSIPAQGASGVKEVTLNEKGIFSEQNLKISDQNSIPLARSFENNKGKEEEGDIAPAKEIAIDAKEQWAELAELVQEITPIITSESLQLQNPQHSTIEGGHSFQLDPIQNRDGTEFTILDALGPNTF